MLFLQDGRFLTWQEMKDRYNFGTHQYLQYIQVREYCRSIAIDVAGAEKIGNFDEHKGKTGLII